jgi:hypothetical protein
MHRLEVTQTVAGRQMDFWATFLGAAFGVVAGTLVQFFTQSLFNRSTEKEQRSGLKKEMQANLALVSDLKAQAAVFRNAINGDSLNKYFGYFTFERGLFSQTTALLNSGKLYKWFSIEDLRKLQLISTKLNVAASSFINQNIVQRRDKAIAGEGYDKSEAVQFANYIDGELRETETLLNQFIALI